MSPLLLYIETATEVCSIAVSRGKEVIVWREHSNLNDHAAQITLMIEACAAEASIMLSDLDAVAVSAGPGSYTALRIGVSTAKGICYALDKPLIAVDTLRALAVATRQVFPNAELYCPMIDARRMDVYASLFDPEGQMVQPPEAITIREDSFEEYFSQQITVAFSGNGAEKCRTVLKSASAVFVPVICSAQHLIPLALAALERGAFADVAYFEPFYLKPPNITTPKQSLL